MNNNGIVTLGAGPAGLAAAYELIKQNVKPVILERSTSVGGIARTECYKGYYFDIGGHRFFTKIDAIYSLWHEMLGKDFTKVRRKSRIYYNERLFDYPLNIVNTLLNLGIFESILILSSYLKANFRPYRKEETFEHWVSNRFGQRLYKTFFKSYTEKVWGIPCSNIQADWAAQRINQLSLTAAVRNAFFGTQNARSLINEFHYPVKGPGMMWQRFKETIEAGGGKVKLDSEVITIQHDKNRIFSVGYLNGDSRTEMPIKHLISSIPLGKLMLLLNPRPPKEVLSAANSLTHRALIIVVLIVDKQELFPDQWIYIHNPNVNVGRIQNFKNWSAAMVPTPQRTSVGLEYFCMEGDKLWKTSDKELIELASRELSQLGLADPDKILDGYVMRQPDAYPVYDLEYQKKLEVIKNYLSGFDNLQSIGRNGMHRYNNMDHSMHMGLMAAQNIFGAKHNLWKVNEDKKYLEETD